MPVLGQLWYLTRGSGNDVRIVRVNDDGTAQTTVLDDSPETILTNTPADIGIDTVNGFYFAIVNDGFGSGASLVRGSLTGGTPTLITNFGTAGDPLVNALFVDAANRRIFVGVQEPSGTNGAQSGIRVYTYAADGTVSGGNLIYTQTSTGKGAEDGLAIFDPLDFAYDAVANRLYFTETLDGVSTGLFSINLASPNSVTQVVSQAQFPDSAANGFINDVEVDGARGRVYFTTQSRAPAGEADFVPAQNAIWTVATGASGATATKLTLNALPAGIAGTFYPGDMAFDATNNQLYVESVGVGSSASDDVILVFQLSADGQSGTWLRTITPSPFESSAGGTIGIVGMTFNALPTLTATTSTTLTEQQPAAAVFATAPVITEAGGYLKSVTIQITGNLTAGDLLSFSAATYGTAITVSSYDAATGRITLSGTDTVANYRTALAGLRYATTSDDPTQGGAAPGRTLTILLDDGSTAVAGSANTVTQAFTVTAVNDAPTAVVPGAQSLAEDTSRTFSVAAGNAISVADPDVGSGMLQVQLTVANGTLTLSRTTGLTFTAGDGTADATMTFRGTPANINAALNGLSFVPPANFNGATSLTMVTGDLGNTGSGGTATRSDTIAVTVTPVNDPPTATNDAFTVAEDSGSTVLNVLANDSFAPDSGETLVVTSVTQPATGGSVTLSGGAVRFTPSANFNGIASFTYTIDDGSGTFATATATVTVTPVDDAPVAVPDAGATTEAAATVIAVLGNDTDIDAGPRSVASIAGTAVASGGSVTLASGAIVTLNADGTLRYDPNGRFSYLVSADKALTNAAYVASATDSFSYTLNGGSVTTVTVTIAGVDDVVGRSGDQLRGSAAADTIVGTGTDDIIFLAAGGSDVASGGAGNDGFFVGGALDADDRINGGAGTLDQVGLQGSYAATLVLAPDTIRGVEMLVFLPGDDTRFGPALAGVARYDIRTDDATVAAGTQMIVQANTLRVGETLIFDGSAETDGSFLMFGGLGSDVLTGGAGDDGFYFGQGRFNAGDRVVGGAGAMDQIALQGNFAGANAVLFGASQIAGVEMIVLLSGADTRFGGGTALFAYDLTMNDANATGTTAMIVQANTLRTGEALRLDASAETATPYTVYGGAGVDIVTGGAGNDEIWGRGGADVLRGGAGNDVFAYLAATDSNADARDAILDFARGDLVDLSRAGFTSFVSGAFTGAGQVRVAGSGTAWTIEGDVDGNGSVDLSIAVTTLAAFSWSADDFRLALPPPIAAVAPPAMDSHALLL